MRGKGKRETEKKKEREGKKKGALAPNITGCVWNAALISLSAFVSFIQP